MNHKSVRNKIGLSILLCSFVSGCANNSNVYQIKGEDPAIKKMIQLVESIEKSNRELANIESAKYVEVNGKKDFSFNGELMPEVMKVVSLGDDWNGPLDIFIVKLSAVAGLNAPRFINVKPSNEIIVNVGTDYRKVLDMLTDAGTQSGSRANLTLKVKERLVEVEYIN